MEDILEVVFKGLLRLVVYVLKEIALEILVRGPGYFITRSYTAKEQIDVDGWEVTIWGVAFWLVIGFGWMVLFK